MRTVAFPAVIPFLLLFPGVLRADAPDLEPAFKIMDGAQDLQVFMYSTPFFVDWNNDGKKDLLVGQLLHGYIWLYLNKGTDLNPVFDGGVQVESDGVPISVSGG